tara:strand:- start:655 stop:1749 length:1095 start_codon:yes stop_codon:yes gene_type:complete
MLNSKSVAVVIPAYNEETQIINVLNSVPSFVDKIIVVNDGSSDATEKIVLDYIENSSEGIKIEKPNPVFDPSNKYNAERAYAAQMKKEDDALPSVNIMNKNPESDRVILLSFPKNQGVGLAVARGYKWCKDYEIDCVAKIDGDGQMDSSELHSICSPVTDNGVDYVKENRLKHRSAWFIIPKIRFFGNSVLSVLTKIASGYWRISDTQTAYTAISKKGLESLALHKLYTTYGYPNDVLVKLNIASCTLTEVEIKPIYNVGENSKMKIFKVIPTVSYLLFKSFFKRLWIKYFFKDFHPLFLFYNVGLVTGILTVPYGIKIVKAIIKGYEMNYEPLLAFIFLSFFTFQSLALAMWMDIQDNERLYK